MAVGARHRSCADFELFRADVVGHAVRDPAATETGDETRPGGGVEFRKTLLSLEEYISAIASSSGIKRTHYGGRGGGGKEPP